MRLLLRGFIYKAAIADTLAQIADPVFAHVEQYSAHALLTATIAFYGQIYFDFAGYSSMAIGTARLFGYRFPPNFNYPYRAASVTEFWRRWHMSLSFWLRDYLYIPLGGNRGGALFVCRNLMITMLLGGYGMAPPGITSPGVRCTASTRTPDARACWRHRGPRDRAVDGGLRDEQGRSSDIMLADQRQDPSSNARAASVSSEAVPADLLTIRAPEPDWFRWAISHPGQSQFVMVAGCRIHYLHWGREPARPGERGLLFVHGGGAHSHWWSYIAPYFTRDFRVAAIDLSGMGDSAW